MNNSSTIKRFLLVLLILIVVFVPLSARARSAQSRVLYEPDDIVTTRKANFQLGDILGTPLVSITVRNNEEPTYLLMVLNFDFGGEWNSEYAEVKMVREMGANEVLAFTNTDLLSYIPNIKTKSYSSTLKTKLGITTMDDIGTAFFNSGMVLPEGTHTVTLKVYDIPTESIPSQLPSVLKEESVSFNVVTIGSINIIETPTVNNSSLTFQVPQIPVYPASVQSTISSTKVRITGPGLDKTLSKNHSASVSGAVSYKGYPGDLKLVDGYVTYDLSTIQFRAGQRYQAQISFLDWNNATIVSKVVDFTAFSTPRMYTDASFTNPYVPVFSWGFTGLDYSSWVKEYRIYLNGSYYGYTNSDSFVVRSPLNPNTTYTWYVMPINRDGSPFFSSADTLTKSFTTKIHKAPEVRIEEPANSAVLIKGESYDFSSDTTLYDGSSLRSITWRIGGETKSGENIRYQPTRRYTAGSLTAQATATDSFGYSGTSATIGLTVLDPVVVIAGGATKTVSKGVATTFSIDTGASQDVSTYMWYVNDAEVGSGARLSYTFNESGTYEVYATGTTIADENGNTKSVDSVKMSVSVVGEGPTVSIIQPTSSVELLLGSPLDIVASITNENRIAAIQWSVTGADTLGGSTGSRFRFSPSKVGEYVITVTVIDVHMKSSSTSTRVLVVDPAINMTAPAANSVFALSSSLTPVIEAPNAIGIKWYVGSREIPGNSLPLSVLGTGRFTAYAVGTWNVVDSQGRTIIHEERTPAINFQVKNLEPPLINIVFPDDDTVFIAGRPYRLQAEVESASNIRDSWWEANGVRLNSANYNPLSSSPSQIRLTHHVVNTDDVASSKSITVRKIDPSVVLTPPATLQYPVGSAIPVTAQAIDSDLYWLVDGVEYTTWDKIFTSSGAHRVQAGWRTTATNSSGTASTFSGLSDPIDFTLYSTNAPRIIYASPSSEFIQQPLGRNVTFSITPESENPIEEIVWSKFVGSETQYQMGENSIGSAFTTSFSESNLYTIRAVATDRYGLSTSKEWTVRAIDPKPVITYPENGMVFALGSVPAPAVSKQGSTSYRLLLDRILIGPDFDWSEVGTGAHTLVAQGSFEGTTIESDPVNFRVEDRRPPEFYLGINNGDRLISGKTYSILASYSTAGDPTVDSFIWLIDGAQESATVDPGVGERYRFQRSVPTAGVPETVNITVRGTLNGISKDKTATVTVLKPSAKALLPASIMQENGYFPMNTPIPLMFEGKHIDRVEWYVDGYEYREPSVTFSDPYMHSIYMKAYVNGVRMPDNDRTDYLVGSENGQEYTFSTDFEVIGKPSIQSLQIADKLYSGQKVPIEVMLQSGSEYLATISYRIDGNLAKESRSPVETSIELPAMTAGNHTIEVIAKDIFGNTSSMSRSVQVYNPLSIALIKPLNGLKVTPATEIAGELQISSGSPARIEWSIDGRAVANSNFLVGNLGRLSEGAHTISVEVVDQLGKVERLSSQVDVQSDFQLTLLAPQERIELITGDSFTCMVSVEKAPGSTVDLADAANHITWYVDGRQVGASGLIYEFTATSSGNHTIQARYSKNSMIRTSEERTVVVREVMPPSIITPLNGTTVTYAPGESIPLHASGENGATYVWEINGTRVASGSQTSFIPVGISGEQQLRLKSSLFGNSYENLATIVFAVNTPPELELAIKEKQLTGSRLEWTVTAFDLEDNGLPAIEARWDGVLINNNEKILETVDIGNHTLAVSAIDSKGAVTVRRKTIIVESSRVDMEIRSPRSNSVYYRNHEIPLQTTLADQRNAGGTYSWVVQYLEDPSLPVESFSGSEAIFRPIHSGEITVVVKYHDADGIERGSARVPITVAEEPLDVQLLWPHGEIVNAATALRPQLLGYDASEARYPIIWELDGNTIENIASLQAPHIGGTHLLKAQYWVDNGYQSKSQLFSVNTPPVVTIEKPLDGSRIASDKPVVFAAHVTDDQSFQRAIRWTDDEGNLIAEGNTMVLTDQSLGSHTITASAEDRFGARGEAVTTYRVFEPISDVVTSVNDNLPSYMVVQGAMPLSAKVNFSGGISPVVTWTLVMEDSPLVKQGKEIFFSYAELENLQTGNATLTCAVTDDLMDAEVFRKDHPIELVKNATATLIVPEAGSTYRVGEDIPVAVGLQGFSRPSIALAINEKDIPSVWNPIEGSFMQGTTIPSTEFSGEGVYDMTISVAENGIEKKLNLSLNIYRSRQGIFVDAPPEIIDLLSEERTIAAVISELTGIDSIRWYSDSSAEPFATGLEAILSSANLTSGTRTITVEAWSGNKMIATTSFTLIAYGKMSIQIQNQIELLILQKEAPAVLRIIATDKDGSKIAGDAITWESHLDGVIGSSETLNFENLSDISKGEHLITIRATGSDGTVITAFQRIQVNDPNALETLSDEILEEEEQIDVGDGSYDQYDNTFDEGEPLDPYVPPNPPTPFGPGGSSMDPTLGGYMNDFMSGYDPYGGGYGGYDPYGGGGYGGYDPYGGGGYGGYDPYGGGGYGGYDPYGGGGYGGYDPYGGGGYGGWGY